MRYVRQYHEVSLPLFPLDDVEERFHAEHNRLYGYHLAEERTPLELINLRARAIGTTDKPKPRALKTDGPDPSHALKNERPVWLTEEGEFRQVPVYDGHDMRPGNRVPGPAVVEQRNTTLFVDAPFDMVVDPVGSFVVYRRGKEGLLPASVQGVA
jgi:N-methylhydantoinase A